MEEFEDSNEDLPEGWRLALLEEICEPPQYGWTTSADTNGRGTKLLRTTDISKGEVDWSTVPGCEREPEDVKKYLLWPGDILVSRAGSVGISYVVKEGPRAVFASYLIRFRPLSPISSDYIGYFLKSPQYWEAIAEETAGIAIPNVNASKLKKLKIPLAPLGEQKRIVAKLEELLPKVNAVRERLIRVKETMKRFHQSVLSAACSGHLTADWRTMRPNVQKATELVKKAQLMEKRRYTEECEKAKRNGKDKPRRPSILELEEIDSHPEIETWAALKMDYAFRPEGLFDGPFGSNLKTSDYTHRGVRVVRIENIGFLSFLEEKRTYISAQKYETLKKHTVREGDLIFASFISDGVRTVVLPNVENAIAKADCFCLRPLPQLLDSRYLAIVLSSRQTYSELSEGIHGATRPRITTKQLRNLSIPLAPFEEQKVIIDRVESLFELAERVEKGLEVELSRTEKITQAILKKTFRGELVPAEAELVRGQRNQMNTRAE